MDNPFTARITSIPGEKCDRVEFVIGPTEEVFVTCLIEWYDGLVSYFSNQSRASSLVDAGVLVKVKNKHYYV